MRDTTRCLFGNQPQGLRQVSPTLIVLESRRTHVHPTDPTEDCAEGDCGACTAIRVGPTTIDLRHRAVNACALFVPSIDGRQTPEAIAIAVATRILPVSQSATKGVGMFSTHGEPVISVKDRGRRAVAGAAFCA
jgi:xanthine dehydrogenase small subunit